MTPRQAVATCMPPGPHTRGQKVRSAPPVAGSSSASRECAPASRDRVGGARRRRSSPIKPCGSARVRAVQERAGTLELNNRRER